MEAGRGSRGNQLEPDPDRAQRDYDDKLRLASDNVFSRRRATFVPTHDRVLAGAPSGRLSQLSEQVQAKSCSRFPLPRKGPHLREEPFGQVYPGPTGPAYSPEPRASEQDLNLRILEESIERVQRAEQQEQKQLNRLIEMGTRGDALMDGLKERMMKLKGRLRHW